MWFVCLVSGGCSQEPTAKKEAGLEETIPAIPAQLGPLIGSWKKNVQPDGKKFVITFKRDYKFKINNGSEIIFGDYTVTDSTLTIHDDDCGDAQGIYRFRADGGSLVLELIADPSNRPKVLPGIWARKY